jgi:hypothetical protein
MKRGTPGHWKILNLAMELKIEPYAAVGICCCMWEWVGASLMPGTRTRHAGGRSCGPRSADDESENHRLLWD